MEYLSDCLMEKIKSDHKSSTSDFKLGKRESIEEPTPALNPSEAICCKIEKIEDKKNLKIVQKPKKRKLMFSKRTRNKKTRVVEGYLINNSIRICIGIDILIIRSAILIQKWH